MRRGTAVRMDALVMRATRVQKVYRIRAAHFPNWFLTVIVLGVCVVIYTITAWATSVTLG